MWNMDEYKYYDYYIEETVYEHEKITLNCVYGFERNKIMFTGVSNTENEKLLGRHSIERIQIEHIGNGKKCYTLHFKELAEESKIYAYGMQSEVR